MLRVTLGSAKPVIKTLSLAKPVAEQALIRISIRESRNTSFEARLQFYLFRVFQKDLIIYRN